MTPKPGASLVIARATGKLSPGTLAILRRAQADAAKRLAVRHAEQARADRKRAEVRREIESEVARLSRLAAQATARHERLAKEREAALDRAIELKRAAEAAEQAEATTTPAPETEPIPDAEAS